MMQLAEFIKYHQPALEANEVKYNLILGLVENPSSAELRLWTLPGPGSCAIQSTPPSLRGRGYAGSVTAAVAERIFAEWKTAACLYTDLRNPSSNRCYAKIGFMPICKSWHYVRLHDDE